MKTKDIIQTILYYEQEFRMAFTQDDRDLYMKFLAYYYLELMKRQ